MTADRYKEVLKQYGVRKVDERGREYYDEPAEWAVPNVELSARGRKWHDRTQSPVKAVMPDGYTDPAHITKKMYAMLSADQHTQFLDDCDGELPEQLTRK